MVFIPAFLGKKRRASANTRDQAIYSDFNKYMQEESRQSKAMQQHFKEMANKYRSNTVIKTRVDNKADRVAAA